jgi:hypothetical protein
VRADELHPVALEQQRLGAVAAQRLALEDEVGNPADQILDSDRGVRPQFQHAHVVSVYRLDQEIIKHWKKFSEAAHSLLVWVAH